MVVSRKEICTNCKEEVSAGCMIEIPFLCDDCKEGKTPLTKLFMHAFGNLIEPQEKQNEDIPINIERNTK